MIGSRRWIAAAAFVALTLGACGGGGDAELTTGVPGAGEPTSTSSPPETAPPFTGAAGRPACELIGQQDVARALGNPVRPGSGQDRYCAWGTQVDRGTSANLTVIVPGPNRARAECDAQRASLVRDARQDPVSGVGTSAVWAWKEVAILLQGALVACYPNAVVVVNVSGEREQASLRDAAVNLAETVHSRL